MYKTVKDLENSKEFFFLSESSEIQQIKNNFINSGGKYEI